MHYFKHESEKRSDFHFPRCASDLTTVCNCGLRWAGRDLRRLYSGLHRVEGVNARMFLSMQCLSVHVVADVFVGCAWCCCFLGINLPPLICMCIAQRLVESEISGLRDEIYPLTPILLAFSVSQYHMEQRKAAARSWKG